MGPFGGIGVFDYKPEFLDDVNISVGHKVYDE
jgi:hypothetical protein